MKAGDAIDASILIHGEYQDASRRAGILVCNPGLGVGIFLESDAWFVWVTVAGMCVYNCYFSPGEPFEVFETQIFLIEESLREASEWSLLRVTSIVSRLSGEKPA